MKNIRQGSDIVSGAFALALALGGCTAQPAAEELAATDASAVAIEETASGSRISLEAGREIVLRIKENPTTGYGWSFASSNTGALAIVSSEFERPNRKPGVCGAPGRHVVRARAIAPGNAKLNGAYARPWEKDQAPAETFSCEISVAPRSGKKPGNSAQ